MSKMAEHDWNEREQEQSDMEADPAYQEWLDKFDKEFAIETLVCYNSSINNLQEK